MENDPSPAHALILERNPAMASDFLDQVRQAMKDYAIYVDEPEAGLPLGNIDENRIREEYQALYRLGKVPAPQMPAYTIADKRFHSPSSDDSVEQLTTE